jgi:hypothetical protein
MIETTPRLDYTSPVVKTVYKRDLKECNFAGKKILDEYSISDQLRAIRKAIIEGDLTEIREQDAFIDAVLSGGKV